MGAVGLFVMKCFNIQSVDERLGTMTAQWSLTALIDYAAQNPGLPGH